MFKQPECLQKNVKTMILVVVSKQFNHTIRLGCIKLIKKTSMKTTKVTLKADIQRVNKGGKEKRGKRRENTASS